MLARNDVEDDAFCDGTYAMMMIDDARGADRLEHMLTLRRCAAHDPSSAYNLAHMMMARSPSEARTRTAAKLLADAIAMVLERLENVDAGPDWPARERSARRLASMAMVNLGNIHQYAFGDPETAHDEYLSATRIYDGNEIAHLNVGQMNYGGLVADPDGDLAYRHYLKAIRHGIRCKSRRPGCECLVDITDALGAVPEAGRTSALPRIRDALAKGEAAIAMPPTTGIPDDLAAGIEAAVDLAFAGLTPDSPIERRVTRVASLAATITGMFSADDGETTKPAHATAIAEDIVHSIGPAARPADRMIMPHRESPESAGIKACMRMYEERELETTVRALARSMGALLEIAAHGDHEAVLTHALKTIFGSASQAWRGGLLSTMPNGFRTPAIRNVIRIAVPGQVGRSSPVDAMRRWAENPATMP